jgi:hypothetical protein
MKLAVDEELCLPAYAHAGMSCQPEKIRSIHVSEQHGTCAAATSLAISASVQDRIHVSERVMRDGNHQDLLRPVSLESVVVSWVQFNARLEGR